MRLRSIPSLKESNNLFLPLSHSCLVRKQRRISRWRSCLAQDGRCLSTLVIDSQNTQRQSGHYARFIDLDKRFPYIHFSVERDVSDIGFEERRREKEIAAYILAYLHEYEVKESKLKCMGCLMNPPDFKHTHQAS